MPDKNTAYVSPNIAGILSLFDPALDWSADLSGDEYATALKEFLVVHQEGSQDPRKDENITTDEVEGIREEYNKVRKNKDLEYSVKRTTIKGDKFMGKEPNKDAPPTADKPKLLTGVGNFKSDDVKPVDVDKNDEDKSSGLNPDRLNDIAKTVESIALLLRRQLGLEKKQQRDTKKQQDKLNKEARESKLESKPDKKTGLIPKSIATPTLNFFDRLKNFFINIAIGSVALKLFDWLNDPSNKEKIEKFEEWITKNAPLIVGGLTAIALLPVLATIIGTVGGIMGGLSMLGVTIPILPLIIKGIIIAAIAALTISAAIAIHRGLKTSITGGGLFDEVDERAKQELKDAGLYRIPGGLGRGKHDAWVLNENGQKIMVRYWGKNGISGRYPSMSSPLTNEYERVALTIGKPEHEAYIARVMGNEKLQEYKDALDLYNKTIFETKDPIKKLMGEEIKKSNKLISEKITKERNESQELIRLRTKKDEAKLENNYLDVMRYELMIRNYFQRTKRIIKQSQKTEANKIREKYNEILIEKFPQYFKDLENNENNDLGANLFKDNKDGKLASSLQRVGSGVKIVLIPGNNGGGGGVVSGGDGDDSDSLIAGNATDNSNLEGLLTKIKVGAPV